MSTPIPKNQAHFSVPELLAASAGRLLSGPAELELCGVTTDSRLEQSGGVFVALRGQHFDGHRFVAAAVERGAQALLVSEPVPAPAQVALIQVPDTLLALSRLALFQRRRWAGRVVAVAGSAGKTTTKNAIAAGLEALFPGQIHATPGNLNNRVGVPLVMLAVQPQHQVAVLELGTNLRGEIDMLAATLEPDLALLTLIDLEHVEGIGALDQIEAEEGDLLARLPSSGLALINGDDPRLRRQLGRCPAQRRVLYGLEAHNDYRLLQREPWGSTGARLQIARPNAEPLTLLTPLLGEPGALATLAALAVCESLGSEPLPHATFERVLGAHWAPEPGRLLPVVGSAGILILDDSYNSNPASLRSSLGVARELAQERNTALVLVLGEMRELGPNAQAEHAASAEAVAQAEPLYQLAVAGAAQALHLAVSAQNIESRFVPDADAALGLLRERGLPPGCVVLVKGSRGVGLERVVAALSASEVAPNAL